MYAISVSSVAIVILISHVPRRDKARQGDWGRASTSGPVVYVFGCIRIAAVIAPI